MKNNLLQFTILVLKSFLVILIGTYSTTIYSQANSCQTAPLLCSLSELNGFAASMPQTNPIDEPAPFCGGTGNPQNMTWFAFISGNENATMTITFENCVAGTIGTTTIQYGVYTDCTFSTYLESACQGLAVPVDDPLEIEIMGMVPGDNYYFFIDGDSGASSSKIEDDPTTLEKHEENDKSQDKNADFERNRKDDDGRKVETKKDNFVKVSTQEKDETDSKDDNYSKMEIKDDKEMDGMNHHRSLDLTGQ